MLANIRNENEIYIVSMNGEMRKMYVFKVN